MLIRSCIFIAACSFTQLSSAQSAPPSTVPSEPTKPAATPLKPAADPRKVAILNFGPPPVATEDDKEPTADIVGVTINPESFESAASMLERDGVGTVVIRVNSFGGLPESIPAFHNVFINTFKPRFRTVGWIELAIGSAALAVYPLDELVFAPVGSFGPCSGGGGPGGAPFADLEQITKLMESASTASKRDAKITRALLLGEPLSMTPDAQGKPIYFQDVSGKVRVCQKGQPLAFTASAARKAGFSSATAATRDELAAALGLKEVQWTGLTAAKVIDDNTLACDVARKSFAQNYQELTMSIGAAERLVAQSAERARREIEVTDARANLKAVRQALEINPRIGTLAGVNQIGLDKVERRIDELSR